MKISTKLRLSSIMIIFLIIFFLTATFSLVFIVQKSYQKQQVTQKITETSFQMSLLRSEYFFNPSERPKAQWVNTYEVLMRTLEEADGLFSNSEEKKLFENTLKVSLDSRILFGKLIQNVEQNGNEIVKEELFNQLTVKSQTGVSNVLLLSQLSRVNANAALFFFELIVVILLFIIGIISIWSYFISRSISGSLKTLSLGTKTIAEGNLNYKLKINKKDEFGILAGLFNAMSEKLKKSYSTLEQNVLDRTKALNEKTKESENANKAVLNILEDLEIEQKNLAEAKAKVEALVKDLEKFKLAVDNASDQIVITDPEAIVLYINAATEKITGYTAEEAIGQKAGKLWGNLMERSFYNNLWKTIKIEKKHFSGEIRNRRKNGKIYEASINIAPILNKSGEVEFFVGIERDITKEKEIDKAKTEFVSLASHQLRTPLTTISWYTEMILNGDVGKVVPRQKKYLEEIYQGDQRMIELVNTLLDVSRMELGTLSIEEKPTDIVSLAQSLIDEQKPKVEEKKLMITTKFNSKIPIISADPKLLRMVLQNLFVNAVTYTPSKGEISFEISLEDKNSILIKIADTGYGIPKHQQGQIFTKLFRADNVREKDTDGTGLGLYIVKSIVEQAGGKVWFESVENKGTTFYVSLPLKRIEKKEID